MVTEYLIPEHFKLSPCIHYDLIRVGPFEDGGYCVTQSSLKTCDFFISIGLGHNISFERQLLGLYKLSGIGVDPGWSWFLWIKHFVKTGFQKTVLSKGSLPFGLKSFFEQLRFQLTSSEFKTIPKKCVLTPKSKKEVSLSSLLSESSNFENICLKMDVEGDEYSLVPEIFFTSNIGILILEFHNINSRLSEFSEILNRLLTVFHISHLHVNPHSRNFDKLPDILEITFERYCYSKQHQSRKTLPILGVDFSQSDDPPEYSIRFS